MGNQQLTLSIKPKLQPSENQCLLSSGYDVTVGDWTLGRGVTDFRLEMPAGQKPKATVTFYPDVMDIDITMAEAKLLGSKDDCCQAVKGGL